jgi:hypothetical protein
MSFKQKSLFLQVKFQRHSCKFVIIALFTYKEIQRIESLVDYNRSHIVAFNEYLEIM